jgi:hypothetical protein
MLSALRLIVLGLVLAGGASAPAPAIGADDPQTEDWERQDREYQERLRQHRQRSDATPLPDDPEERRRELIRRYHAEADRLILDSNYVSRTGKRYRLKTDDPRLDTAAALGLLEELADEFERFWRGRVALRDEEDPVPIYLFWSFKKYNELLTGNPRFGEFRPAGHYTAALDTVAIHTDAGPPANLPEVLLHEAAHQLVERRLFGPGRPRSLWVDEGLADYFAMTLRNPAGRLEFGRLGGKDVSVVRKAPRAAAPLARTRLDAMKRRLRSDPAWELDSLIWEADPRIFYGESTQARYDAAWLLVHYLFHGEGGALADRFVAYLQLDADGTGGPEVFHASLGRSHEELVTGLRAHVAALRAG